MLRTNQYRKCTDSIGNYTPICGMMNVRQNITEFISRRDGINDISYKDILVTNGTGNAIRGVLESLINSKKNLVMAPIPNFSLNAL